VIHRVRLGFEVGRMRAKYARFESLRVAIDQWKPSALHLHGNAMAFLEYMRRGMQVKRVFEHLVRGKCRGMFEARAKAAAVYVIGDHQLPAAHGRRSGLIGWVNIDEFDDPIRIGAGGTRIQFCGDVAAIKLALYT